MKHFNNADEQTKILDDNGAFFAFSSEQWELANDISQKYKSLGAGLYCPEKNVDSLTKQLNESNKLKIKWELDNNPIKDIIWYAFANYECQINGDTSDALEALKDYGVTNATIKDEYDQYFKHCVDNDYFYK